MVDDSWLANKHPVATTCEPICSGVIMQRLGDMREKEAPTIGEYITLTLFADVHLPGGHVIVFPETVT